MTTEEPHYLSEYESYMLYSKEKYLELIRPSLRCEYPLDEFVTIYNI